MDHLQVPVHVPSNAGQVHAEGSSGEEGTYNERNYQKTDEQARKDAQRSGSQERHCALLVRKTARNQKAADHEEYVQCQAARVKVVVASFMQPAAVFLMLPNAT